MSRPVLLFAPETFNIAETTRMLEIAKAAQEQFTPHFMGYGGQFVHLIEEAGFPFHYLKPGYTQAKIDHLWKIDRMEAWGDLFTVDEVRQRVNSELTLYNALQPVAIIIGFTLTVYVSARVAHIPLVAVTPFAFTRPFFEAGLGTWPEQFLKGPLKWMPRAWLNSMLTWWGLHTKAWTKNFNIVLKHYGVKPFSTLMESWEADYMLIAEIPDVTGIYELPKNWCYVGPIFAQLSGDIPQEVQQFADNRPLIYCAMGSSGNQAVVQQVIEAFKDTPYYVVAPVQSHIKHTNTHIPNNVLVTGWLPAPMINPLANIAVIHGGHGTVQTACISGTPFVGIGMQPEQEWNIDFLVRKGCALRIGRNTVSHNKLIQAIEQLLHDQHAHQVARQIQSIYRQWDGAKNTAQFLRTHFT